MIISSTPFRISLFGGGTDYPQWFQNHGGAVIGMAIDKNCFLSVRELPPFFEHKSRIVYSQVELINEIEEIVHPSVRGILTEMNIKQGMEIHHMADLPARSGLGSSSAFTVGLIHALQSMNDSTVSKENLAKKAIYIEQEVLKEVVGSQDQVFAAFGGFNRIEFYKDGSFQVKPILLEENIKNALLNSFMLFFTGISRFASEIAGTQIENLKDSESERHQIREIVDVAGNLLKSKSFTISEIGRLLGNSWELKKNFGSNVSNKDIDEIYETGIRAGAYGGKLLGAGGGGFFLFIVDPRKREAVLNALRGLVHVDFSLNYTGSQIIFKNPEN